MNGKRGTLASYERVILDGVAYNVSVYVTDNTYRAVWRCGACSNRSALEFVGATANAAIESAKADLAAHQAAMHTRSSR
jgi:hypothetical protein